MSVPSESDTWPPAPSGPASAPRSRAFIGGLVTLAAARKRKKPLSYQRLKQVLITLGLTANDVSRILADYEASAGPIPRRNGDELYTGIGVPLPGLYIAVAVVALPFCVMQNGIYWIELGAFIAILAAVLYAGVAALTYRIYPAVRVRKRQAALTDERRRLLDTLRPYVGLRSQLMMAGPQILSERVRDWSLAVEAYGEENGIEPDYAKGSPAAIAYSLAIAGTILAGLIFVGEIAFFGLALHKAGFPAINALMHVEIVTNIALTVVFSITLATILGVRNTTRQRRAIVRRLLESDI